MSSPLTGIHHVTALARHPAECRDFYTRVLGLRMVKKTVNFDDPLTYHLYFGDRLGSPGTILTHFPHPMAKRGDAGSPEIATTVLAVPGGSLEFWRTRLAEHHVACADTDELGASACRFEDPHGMGFVLVESDARQPPSPVDPSDSHAITGVDRVVVEAPEADRFTAFVQDLLGFNVVARDAGRTRFALDAGGPTHALTEPDVVLEVVERPGQRSRMGAGTVHHVAWRVPDDDAQALVRATLVEAGCNVTPVMDRQYFSSIYFRVPGGPGERDGVIFEVATDGPGFDADERSDHLGTSLKLPPMHEPRRAEIERHLVPLD